MDAEMMSDDELVAEANRIVTILQEQNDEDCAEVMYELIIRYNVVCEKIRELVKNKKGRKNALR